MALGLSAGGSEASALHILFSDGRVTGALLPDLHHATVAWRGEGLLFSRQQRPGGPPVAPGVFTFDPAGGVEACVFPGRPEARYSVQRDEGALLVVESIFPGGALFLDTGAGLEVIDEYRGWAPVLLHGGAVHVCDDRGHRVWDGAWRTLDPRPAPSATRRCDARQYFGSGVKQ